MSAVVLVCGHLLAQKWLHFSSGGSDPCVQLVDWFVNGIWMKDAVV